MTFLVSCFSFLVSKRRYLARDANKNEKRETRNVFLFPRILLKPLLAVLLF